MLKDCSAIYTKKKPSQFYQKYLLKSSMYIILCIDYFYQFIKDVLFSINFKNVFVSKDSKKNQIPNFFNTKVIKESIINYLFNCAKVFNIRIICKKCFSFIKDNISIIFVINIISGYIFVL